MGFRRETLLSLALAAVLLAFFTAYDSMAQSGDIMFPTPLRQPVIEGTVKPRPIGDARLTTYYFTFDGDQGDLFINVKTENFIGDIDLYLASGLKPLTKIVIYADAGERETGRVVYLRKPERLILRIEGRSQGDDEARFQIKLAGGFVASAAPDAPAPPRVPQLIASDSNTQSQEEPISQSNNRASKDTSTADLRSGENNRKRAENGISRDAQSGSDSTISTDQKDAEKRPDEIPRVIISDPFPDASKDDKVGKGQDLESQTGVADVTAEKENAPMPSKKRRPESRRPVAKPGPESQTAKTSADPLRNIRLIIRFRDGSVIERPLPEVLRFSVERGVLTVIMRNGAIGRYSMLDVANVTIE